MSKTFVLIHEPGMADGRGRKSLTTFRQRVIAHTRPRSPAMAPGLHVSALNIETVWPPLLIALRNTNWKRSSWLGIVLAVQLSKRL